MSENLHAFAQDASHEEEEEAMASSPHGSGEGPSGSVSLADAEGAALWPLIEWAPIAMAITDSSGVIRSVNRRLEALFDYPRAELLGKPVEVLVPERMQMGHVRKRQRFNSQADDRMMGSERDLIGRRKDGSEFPIEAGLSTVPWQGERMTVATVLDISRRKEAAELLEARVVERTRELERRSRVADGLREVLAALNSNRHFEDVLATIVNQAAMVLGAETVAIYQLEPKLDTWQLVAGRHPGQEQEGDGNCLRTVQEAVREGQPISLASGGPGCGDRTLLAAPLTIRSEPYGGLLLAFNHPDKVNAEVERLAETVADQAALAIENARTRARAGRAAVAAERSRIARDLHDSVSQTLFSANLISEVLPRVWERDPEAGNMRLEELQQLTRGALAEMRTLLLELRPDVLHEVPLPELLRQLADAFEGRARVPLTLETSAAPDLPAAVRVALYRTAQEALNNVARHARAHEASMSLSHDDDSVRLVVADDGGGFGLGSVPAGHLGLRTMRERAEEIGAELTIDTVIGEGTTVTVTWPRSAGSIAPQPAAGTDPSAAGVEWGQDERMEP